MRSFSDLVRIRTELADRRDNLDRINSMRDGLLSRLASMLDIPIEEDAPIVQAGETDGKFLRNLANKFGWSFTATSGKAHLTPRWWRRKLGVIHMTYRAADSAMVKVEAKYKKPSYNMVPTAAFLRKEREIDAFIASGGMGAVYKVWDLNRNVFLAMKVLN